MERGMYMEISPGSRDALGGRLYRNKYRISSARLPSWDYSSPGYYFVTVCTNYFVEYFGGVEQGNVVLNDMGRIATEEWSKIPQIRPNVTLDEWVVMPNHMHGIINIGEHVETPSEGVSTQTTRTIRTIPPSTITNVGNRACWVRLSTNINDRAPSESVRFAPIFRGNHVFTTSSFGTKWR